MPAFAIMFDTIDAEKLLILFPGKQLAFKRKTHQEINFCSYF
jgi:hypothetical protein